MNIGAPGAHEGGRRIALAFDTVPDQNRRVIWLGLVIALAAPPAAVGSGLTLIEGIRVGHHTLSQRPTGCTVVLTEGGAVAGVDVRGSAPGSREVALLAPVNTVERVHAVVLSGGSAFGLDSASGVVRYLEDRDIGLDVGIAKVPIVPAAILFDLGVGGKPDVRPGADCGFQAARAATSGVIAQGNVGVGAGATVGKSSGPGRAMKGGIGTAAIELPNGLVVAALIAVNALGDVIDPATGELIAGVRDENGSGLADVRKLLRSGALVQDGLGRNTTIGVVATNARLTKTQATKIAQMAHDGLARAIVPAHTPSDGDMLFALALGNWKGDARISTVGALAAEAVSAAILSAIANAEGIPGFPAASDINP
ncbi:MAG: P1 family peptidase [Pseudomonadales bacterium]|jgi:L-aminopeptidase/D-esterase-like protein|nr:P1 family peptidase [Pseudomonadales bacterium]MDP6470033.1 P1 family peptidase [Pseudomonadales bacterium]MDP6826933.1 P1 family peptidase [Pseudomonadales bacterium]MDP6971031.1 P1 family peptidase [Pseudomonadales bacterium]